MLQQELLADAEVFRGDLHEFVVVDELDGLFQRHADRRGQLDVLVGPGGTDVGELLGLERVHDQVVLARVQPNDHALVNLFAGTDEQLASVLQVEQGEAQRLAGGIGDQHAVLARGDRPRLIGTVVVEDVVQDAGTGGGRHELGLEADQPTRRDDEVQAHAALAVRDHVGHVAAAFAELLHDGALVLFLDVDSDGLVRLLLDAVDLLDDHLGTRHGQLVPLAAHVLDEDAQVQLAAPGDLELVRVLALFHAQGHVVLELFLQAVAQHAGGDVLALASGERRGVDLEGHAHGRLVDGQRFHCLDVVRIAQGVGDEQLVHPGEGDDVAGTGLFDLDALQAVEAHDLQHAAVAHAAFAVHHFDRGVRLDASALHASDADQALIAVVVQRGDLHLERAVGVHVRGRDVLDDGLQQTGHVALGHAGVQPGKTVQGGGEHDREVQLLVGRTQAIKQVEHLVHGPVGARAGAVHLVDHHDRLEAHREGLLGDEAGLGHWAVDCVHQQQHRVDHRQHTFDLATEVGVSGGVDDIDAVILPLDGRVLGQDGDPAFLFDGVGVHDPIAVVTTLVEGAGLAQELVDQRGLAMIDVGDDGDVAKLLGHGIRTLDTGKRADTIQTYERPRCDFHVFSAGSARLLPSSRPKHSAEPG